MMQFTFCNNHAEPQTAYLQRIVLGEPCLMPSEVDLAILSTEQFSVLDTERIVVTGGLKYTTTCRGGKVTYQTMEVEDSLYKFKEGDEVLLVKKNLSDEKAYLFTSREMFESTYNVAVPALMCSIIHLKEKEEDSLHLFVDGVRAMTLMGRSVHKTNPKVLKQYRKEILEKLQEEFELLDAPRVTFKYPKEGINALYPTLRTNFYLCQEPNEEIIGVDEPPSLTCPFIHWVVKEGKLFFLLMELEGIKTPIRGIRHFKGNERYFEQLVNWYYTVALME